MSNQQQFHHGVLLKINQHGLLIIGEPGIGKSSFALELLHEGHQLVADDNVLFEKNDQGIVMGSCPDMLRQLLHTRELGLINIADTFSENSCIENTPLDYVIQLQSQITPVTLNPEQQCYQVCDQPFALLRLNVNTPTSLKSRLYTWLTMRTSSNDVVSEFETRQQHIMAQQQ